MSKPHGGSHPNETPAGNRGSVWSWLLPCISILLQNVSSLGRAIVRAALGPRDRPLAGASLVPMARPKSAQLAGVASPHRARSDRDELVPRRRNDDELGGRGCGCREGPVGRGGAPQWRDLERGERRGGDHGLGRAAAPARPGADCV